MIEVPGVESPSHVVEKGRDDGNDVEVGHEDIEGKVEGDEEEEKVDEGPVEPWQSGCKHQEPVRDDDHRYSVSSYKWSDQSHDLCAQQVGTNYAYMVQMDIPCTYLDAMNRSNSDSWLEACQDELLSLKETRTYIPVSTDEVKASNIVGCHWVFALISKPRSLIEVIESNSITSSSSISPINVPQSAQLAQSPKSRLMYVTCV